MTPAQARIIAEVPTWVPTWVVGYALDSDTCSN